MMVIELLYWTYVYIGIIDHTRCNNIAYVYIHMYADFTFHTCLQNVQPAFQLDSMSHVNIHQMIDTH